MIHISVITCTYNAAQQLPRTLASVLQQRYQHVEHIIMDGASTDGTLKMVQEYKVQSDEMENGHTVSITSQRDEGLYYAMNMALKLATGNYVVFLNAGDVFTDNGTLELVANSVGEGETLPAVLYGDTDVVNDDGRFLYHRRPITAQNIDWRSFRHGMLICHQAFYARTDIAQATPYDLQYRLSADVDWCIRVMKTAEQQSLPIRNVHAVVANYLHGGMSVQHHRASLIERFRIMQRHYGLLSTLFMHLWFVVRRMFKTGE